MGTFTVTMYFDVFVFQAALPPGYGRNTRKLHRFVVKHSRIEKNKY